MDDIVGYIMWGLLGIFLLGLIGGMLFGMLRGPKRTAKRILVLVFFSLMALLITPWISGIFVKAALNIKISGDETLYQTITGALPEEALDTLPEVEALALGLPVLVLNIFVFWILMLLFRFVVSPIVQALFLKKIFPKKDANGEKIPFNRWAGLGMGALQGFVLFLFMFIPITGLMSSIDKIDGYRPKIGGATVNVFDAGSISFDSDSDGLNFGDFNKEINNLNKSIQETPIGIITKFTGTQLVGDLGLGRLMTVNAGKQSINVKAECETVFELTRDAVAIYNLFSDIDNARQLVPIFSDSKKVDYLNSVVRKVFRLGVIELALNSEFGEFAQKADILGDMDMGIVDDQAVYNKSIYKGISKINRDFVRDDVLSMIEIVRLVFAEHKIGPSQEASLYYDIDDLLFVMNNAAPLTISGITYTTKQSALDAMFKKLDKTLTQTKFETTIGKGKSAVTTTRNLAEQILHVFGRMNIFQKLLLDTGNPNLYRMPLSKALGMSNPNDATIENFDAVMDGLANIVIRIVKIGPTVYNLSNGGEVTDLADILDAAGPETITALGQILEILTNRGERGADGFYYYQSVNADGNPETIKVMGTGNILRTLLKSTLQDNFKGSNDGVVTFDAVLGSILNKLSPTGPDIAWAAELNGIVKVVKELGGLLDGEINPDELIDKLLDPDGGLLELIEGSELLSEIIVDILDGIINETLDGTGVKFDFGGVTNPVAVIKALGALVGTGVEMTEWIQEGLDGGKFDDLASIEDLFGGKSVLEQFANSGLKIEITGATPTLQGDVAALDPSDPVKHLFVFK